MEKRLYKSKNNRIIAGVCGGIGEYFNVDPTLIRLIAVISAFVTFGVLIYIIAALFIPSYAPDDFEQFENIKNANPDYREKPKKKRKVMHDDEFDSYFEK